MRRTSLAWLLCAVAAVGAFAWLQIGDERGSLAVVVAPNLTAEGAWHVGRQRDASRPDLGEITVDVDAQREPSGAVHARVRRTRKSTEFVTELWIQGGIDRPITVEAVAGSRDPGGGGVSYFGDLEGTATVNRDPFATASREASELVLSYRLVGDFSGSPVEWRGALLLPATLFER